MTRLTKVVLLGILIFLIGMVGLYFIVKKEERDFLKYKSINYFK